MPLLQVEELYSLDGSNMVDMRYEIFILMKSPQRNNKMSRLQENYDDIIHANPTLLKRHDCYPHSKPPCIAPNPVPTILNI